MDIQRLHRLIAAVCPIDGVSIRDADDKTQWDIVFTTDATDAQRAAAGAVVSAFDPTIADIPQTVTPRQARLALLHAGLLDQVEAAVTSAGGVTKITWDYATQINRTDPLIAAISAGLNLTADVVDALFTHAATL